MRTRESRAFQEEGQHVQRSSGKREQGVQRPDRVAVSRAWRARRGTGELSGEECRSYPREALALGHGWEQVAGRVWCFLKQHPGCSCGGWRARSRVDMERPLQSR